MNQTNTHPRKMNRRKISNNPSGGLSPFAVRSHKEVGKMMGLPPHVVAYHERKALAKLRRAFNENPTLMAFKVS
jgi:hypothetical protein